MNAGQPVELERHPDPQPSERAGQFERIVGEVGYLVVGVKIVKVGGIRGMGGAEMMAVANEDAASPGRPPGCAGSRDGMGCGAKSFNSLPSRGR